MSDNTTNAIQRLPLTSDYVFKRIFGQEENKSALIDFLEGILEIKIQNVQINNPEIPKDFYDSKYGVLDLKVTLDNRLIVNVEMQMQNQYNIEQRSTFYMTSTYAKQLGEREGYENCKKVIVINILNFNYYKRNSYHSIARMIFEPSDETAQIELGYDNEDKYASNYLEMHMIELPKFKEKNPEIGTKLEQWLWLFIGGEEKVKKASKVNKEVERINKKLASMSLSQEERNNYEFRLKAIRDEITFKSNAKKQIEEIIKGREEIAKGQEELVKGREELSKGQEELVKGREELSKGQEELVKGREELSKGQEELVKGREELSKGQEELAKEQEKLTKAKEEMYAEKKKIIKNLLKQNFKIEQIAQIIGSDKNEIEQIVKQIKNI